MDKQDGQDGELKYGEITRAVIGSAFEVMKELGAGFLESVYDPGGHPKSPSCGHLKIPHP